MKLFRHRVAVDDYVVLKSYPQIRKLLQEKDGIISTRTDKFLRDYQSSPLQVRWRTGHTVKVYSRVTAETHWVSWWMLM